MKRLAFSPGASALYAVPVRQASALPAASFRFRLATDTLAVRLTVPLAGPVEDFHLQIIDEPPQLIKGCGSTTRHAWHTKCGAIKGVSMWRPPFVPFRSYQAGTTKSPHRGKPGRRKAQQACTCPPGLVWCTTNCTNFRGNLSYLRRRASGLREASNRTAGNRVCSHDSWQRYTRNFRDCIPARNSC